MENANFPCCKWVIKPTIFGNGEETPCLVYQPTYEDLLSLFEDCQRTFWRASEIRHYVELHLWRYGMVDRIAETLERLKQERNKFYGNE